MSDFLTMDNEIINSISGKTGVSFSEEQLKILQHRGGCVVLACAGSGKALVNGTGVLTPNGYVAIENLREGDICYNEDGKEQYVCGVYPQGQKEVYEVEFSDSTIIRCCDEHLWTYQTYNTRRTNKKFMTNTLRHIIDNVPISVYPHTSKKGESHVRANIYIPMNKPVEFGWKFLPIKPYTLGALLGDGSLGYTETSRELSFTNEDTDVLNKMREELADNFVTLSPKGDGISYRLNSPKHGGTGKSPFILALSKLGLLNTHSYDKFIPEDYKYATIEDRIELIKGLIDTDGHCNGTEYEITLKSERLIDDIKFILESLGMTAVKNAKSVGYKDGEGERVDCGTAYRLLIKTSDLIPKIHYSKRREAQWKTGQTSARRSIVEIRNTGKFAEMTCISVANPTGLFLTENCVVTHNTTTVINLIAKRVLSGEISDVNKVLCTTYSKDGSGDMEVRLRELLKKLGINVTIPVKTLHASYFQVLRAFGIGGNVCSGSQRMMFLRKACKDNKIKLDDDDMMVLDSLISYQINNMMSDTELVQSCAFTLDDVTESDFAEIRKAFAKYKEMAGVIDFDDMQLYMYTMLCRRQDPNVLAYCHSLWQYFFVDEFQDVSKIQFEILRALVTDPNKLVVIGDDDQCIYEWRGANPNIILNICGYYPLQKFILSTNYRCYGEIVNNAAVGIRHNKIRENKSMVPFRDGGTVKVGSIDSGDLYKMSKAAVEYIKELDVMDVRMGDVAVLCRNNNHLSLVYNMLFRDGIICKTSRDITFAQAPLVQDIKKIISMMENTYNRFDVGSTIWKMVPFLGTKGGKAFEDFMDATGCSFKDSLGYILFNYLYKNVAYNTKIKIPTTADKTIGYKFRSYQSATTDALVEIYDCLCSDELEKSVRYGIEMYRDGVAFMYNTPDSARYLNGVLTYISQLIKENGIDDTLKFLNASDQYEKGNLTAPGGAVTLSTMHGAKGREWRNVVLFADDNISFPSFTRLYALMENKIATNDIYTLLDGDRRLHYVAMTRAKEELLIISDKNNASMYLLESLGVLPECSDSNYRILCCAGNCQLDPAMIKDAYDKIFSENSKFYKDLESYVKPKVDILKTVEELIEMRDEADNCGDFEMVAEIDGALDVVKTALDRVEKERKGNNSEVDDSVYERIYRAKDKADLINLRDEIGDFGDESALKVVSDLIENLENIEEYSESLKHVQERIKEAQDSGDMETESSLMYLKKSTEKALEELLDNIEDERTDKFYVMALGHGMPKTREFVKDAVVFMDSEFGTRDFDYEVGSKAAMKRAFDAMLPDRDPGDDMDY